MLEGVNNKEVSTRVIKRLQKYYLECARMLIQQRSCIEEYNIAWNFQRNCFEFPLDSSDDYVFVESVYLGKPREGFIKATNEPLEFAKSKGVLNDISVKEEYKESVSNDIINLLKKFLHTEKRVTHNKNHRKDVKE